MISRENYKEAHIRELQASSKGDPGLIERTLYAFGLLEALRQVIWIYEAKLCRRLI